MSPETDKEIDTMKTKKTTTPYSPHGLFLSATLGEEKYIEFDDVFELYGVFGLESGFCYSQHYTYEEAKGRTNS